MSRYAVPRHAPVVRPTLSCGLILFAFATAALVATAQPVPACAQTGALAPMTAEELQLFGYDPAAPREAIGDSLSPSGPGAGPQVMGAEYGLMPPTLPGVPASPGLAPPDMVRPSLDGGSSVPIPCGDCWSWQLMPDGLMYPAYLASVKESRLGTQAIYVRNHGWFLDSTLGGRVALVRYGTEDALRPEGWQLDVEGAAFPRLDPEAQWELRSSDFRIGIPLTFRRGRWEGKLGYYHLCAHLGDLFLLERLNYPRITYVRDSAILGIAFRPWPDVRFYWETACAFHIFGEAKPWEFQLGAEFSPVWPSGVRGTPFAAVNSHLREDNDFSGNVTMQTGWQWRGRTGHLMRVGLQYFNGLSETYQFYTQHEDQVGAGLWYDF